MFMGKGECSNEQQILMAQSKIIMIQNKNK